MASDSTHRVSTDISVQAILKVVLVLAGILFLYSIRSIIGALFVSIILASAFTPMVNWFQYRGVPRVLAVVIIYVLLFGTLGVLIGLLVPAITEQIQLLVASLPAVYEKVVSGYINAGGLTEGKDLITTLQDTLTSVNEGLFKVTGGIFAAAINVFGGIVSFVGVLVLTFYMTLEENGFQKFIRSIAPPRYQAYLINLTSRIQTQLGGWLRGQLILSAIIAVLSTVGLWILGVKFFLVLGLLAGFLEIIPYLGPILAAIPAVFLALTQQPIKAVAVIILYIIIQQLENTLIVPKVMQRTVGMNPVIIIVVMLIGGQVAGIVGIIVAVPTAIMASIFLRDLAETHTLERGKPEEKDS